MCSYFTFLSSSPTPTATIEMKRFWKSCATCNPQGPGFSLNTRGREQLNFELLKENVIREVSDPLKEPREISVFNPHKITHDVNTKQLETVTEIKRYKLVFDKRVVDPNNYFSYPYGYLRYDLAGDKQDDMNVELLCEL